MVDRGCAALFVAVVTLTAQMGSGQRAAGDKWAVGAATREFVPPGTYNWRGAATQELLTSVWYPVTLGTSTSEHKIGPTGSPLFRLGNWTDDAHPVTGPFPLIVLSHGTGGSAQMLAWLARALASRGYIV